MMLPCLNDAFSIGTPERDPEKEPKHVLFSKEKPCLDGEQEKFHPNEPKASVRRF
jgi:hypothetical protein